MELDEDQIKTLKELRSLIHDDSMNCENMAMMMEIEFWREGNDPELAVLGGHMANALRLRAEMSKTAISFLRGYYPLFMDKKQ